LHTLMIFDPGKHSSGGTVSGSRWSNSKLTVGILKIHVLLFSDLIAEPRLYNFAGRKS